MDSIVQLEMSKETLLPSRTKKARKRKRHGIRSQRKGLTDLNHASEVSARKSAKRRKKNSGQNLRVGGSTTAVTCCESFEGVSSRSASSYQASDPLKEEEEESLLDWVEQDLELKRWRLEFGNFEKETEGHTINTPNGGSVDAIKHYRGQNCETSDEDRVLRYVLKRSVVTNVLPSLKVPARTTRTAVIACGKRISVTVTNEALAIQRWIERQSGTLFGLDVEWRPNRQKGLKNKVALLQICGDNDCLIVQLLFLDRIPDALVEFLLDPVKSFAGVGIASDTKKLQQDYGLVCLRRVELTILAVERLKRDDLLHVGLKVLVQQVLGFDMRKPKRVTMSNWAKQMLDRVQVEYACIDAWASFAIPQKLMAK